MTSPLLIARIKDATDLVALVSAYREIRQSRMLCPWHEESRPSCRVYDDHVWCFSCNQGGDAFAFLMQVEQIPFNEALRRLADAAGISLDEQPVSREAMRYAKQEAAACAWWWKQRRERQMRVLYENMESEDEDMLEIIAMPLRADEELTIAERFAFFRAHVTEHERAAWRAEVQDEREFAENWMALAEHAQSRRSMEQR